MLTLLRWKHFQNQVEKSLCRDGSDVQHLPDEKQQILLLLAQWMDAVNFYRRKSGSQVITRLKFLNGVDFVLQRLKALGRYVTAWDKDAFDLDVCEFYQLSALLQRLKV